MRGAAVTMMPPALFWPSAAADFNSSLAVMSRTLVDSAANQRRHGVPASDFTFNSSLTLPSKLGRVPLAKDRLTDGIVRRDKAPLGVSDSDARGEERVSHRGLAAPESDGPCLNRHERRSVSGTLPRTKGGARMEPRGRAKTDPGSRPANNPSSLAAANKPERTSARCGSFNEASGHGSRGGGNHGAASDPFPCARAERSGHLSLHGGLLPEDAEATTAQGIPLGGMS